MNGEGEEWRGGADSGGEEDAARGEAEIEIAAAANAAMHAIMIAANRTLPPVCLKWFPSVG
jgi:hypothetical protein